jgi:UDP-2-acetamido-2-deoxy-ribo-hexuluronate aminotransferase
MLNIQMVDLKTQYERIKIEVDEEIQQVINQTTFINGPQVKQFTEDLMAYTGAKHVVTCGNGTDALQIAMMALGFSRGDEVIVPAFTYIATVEVIALLGLVPIFVDVTPDTFEIDTNQLVAKITSRTVGIVVVHLFGQCSDMEEILAIAEQHDLQVIEDNAQAIGSVYTFSEGFKKQAGTIGKIGTTSFFPSKNLGCYGDGGALFTDDQVLAENLKMIANHGQKRKYFHDSIGVNSRLDTLQAAILRIKLKNLDSYILARNAVADKYDRALLPLDSISAPARSKKSTHVFHQYTTLLKDGNTREDLRLYLKEKEIPSMIYYPVPVHLQKGYLGFGGKKGMFPMAEDLCERVISLPIHTEMTEDQQEYIIHHLTRYFK